MPHGANILYRKAQIPITEHKPDGQRVKGKIKEGRVAWEECLTETELVEAIVNWEHISDDGFRMKGRGFVDCFQGLLARMEEGDESGEK